jgi:hypothetical protein
MLSFDDDIIAPAPQPRIAPPTPATIRAQGAGSIASGLLSREPVHDLDVERQAMAPDQRFDPWLPWFGNPGNAGS